MENFVLVPLAQTAADFTFGDFPKDSYNPIVPFWFRNCKGLHVPNSQVNTERASRPKCVDPAVKELAIRDARSWARAKDRAGLWSYPAIMSQSLRRRSLHSAIRPPPHGCWFLRVRARRYPRKS